MYSFTDLNPLVIRLSQQSINDYFHPGHFNLFVKIFSRQIVVKSFFMHCFKEENQVFNVVRIYPILVV